MQICEIKSSYIGGPVALKITHSIANDRQQERSHGVTYLDGEGSGSGYGHGSGYNYDFGYGHGAGFGSGSGYGRGSGSGSGNKEGVMT